METTVTMSLDRFKELEAAEKLINLSKTNEKFYVCKVWDRWHFLSRDEFAEIIIQDRLEALKMRDEIIAQVREYEKTNNVKKSFFRY